MSSRVSTTLRRRPGHHRLNASSNWSSGHPPHREREARLLLHDGRGGHAHPPPRPHTVPLFGDAAKDLAECTPGGVFAMTTDNGEAHVAATSLSLWAVDAAGDCGEDFQANGFAGRGA